MISKRLFDALRSISHETSDIKKNYLSIRNFQNFSSSFSDDVNNGFIFADGEINGVPIRTFYPDNMINNDVIIYFHGGGWVTGNIKSYSSVCAEISLRTKRQVIAVEYRLAPENKFPCAVEDAYNIVKTISEHKDEYEINAERVIIIGDSAGGNLCASINLMARDKNEKICDMQILLYPVIHCDYSENTPFNSVHELRDKNLLTAKRMSDYVELYSENEDDWKNAYFSPIMHESPINQPQTLIMTAEYDILRDEGEKYGEKLLEYGNKVEIKRIKDVLHGFIVLPIKFEVVNYCYNYIKNFIDNGGVKENGSQREME